MFTVLAVHQNSLASFQAHDQLLNDLSARHFEHYGFFGEAALLIAGHHETKQTLAATTISYCIIHHQK